MKVYCEHALDKKLVCSISDRLKRTISAKDDLIKNIEILLTTVDEIWKDKPVSKWKMYWKNNAKGEQPFVQIYRQKSFEFLIISI